MKHESITITGAELENRWESDNRTAADVAGLDRIDADALYELSWPDHVVTPRFNGDCNIRLVVASNIQKYIFAKKIDGALADVLRDYDNGHRPLDTICSRYGCSIGTAISHLLACDGLQD